MYYQITPLSDHGITIELGKDIGIETHNTLQLISTHLDNHPFEWMIEYVPAFTTITIYYDPQSILLYYQKNSLPYEFVCKQIKQMLAQIYPNKKIPSKEIEIPVCYGGEFGPDLETVANTNQLTVEEVINLHTSATYQVYMIGFAPGFPYLGGLSPKLATPRRKSPRIAIPAGSVGIAGQQTGIYPLETPGGWQLIGRTPLSLFRPKDHTPSLLKAGDTIKFKSISYDEYREWEEIRTNDYNS